MSELINTVSGELDNGEFFAPMSSDLLDSLLGQYKQLRHDLTVINKMIMDNSHVVGYFLSGNGDKRSNYYAHQSVKDQFSLDGALASLNSDFWSRTMNLTDVYEYMPEKRRDEWNTMIREMTCPDFDEETVRPTIADLLNSRQKFFSERVDGIFRGLSGEHVTNRPEGFGKRMIMNYVFNDWGSVDYRKEGLISDLHKILSKFMGRHEPRIGQIRDTLEYARKYKTGQWVDVDGGIMRVRAYLKGTAHLEVHPEMAWRLNGILAFLYPNAIPSQFRSKPKKKLKDFQLINDILPPGVLHVISKMRSESTKPRHYNHGTVEPLTTNPFNLSWGINEPTDKVIKQKVIEVMESIGGVMKIVGKNNNYTLFEFDYLTDEVIGEILSTGTIPNKKSHQYYPTPEKLAKDAVALAEIDDSMTVLEPSAGQGGIADHLPGKVKCVEVSKIHCQILESKGFDVDNADFMKWEPNQKFDRVVMNPPFSEGRAEAHTIKASTHVSDGGKLVAILPASFSGKSFLDGFECVYTPVYKRAFADASINTVILVATKNS